MTRFNYYEAFERNVGWVSEEELRILKGKRIAIAGLGGVGGYHLLTLLRLGIEKFHIADMDKVELANFNRQACATVSTLDMHKAEIMQKMALDINPEAEIKIFPEGVSEENLQEFLEGVDLYVDGLDFFVLGIRELIFRECDQRKIPAMTTAPLGMGAAHLNFLPGGMSFDHYFRLGDVEGNDKYIQFLIGLSPALLQRGYLKDITRVDFSRKKGPSTPMACELCAGIAATEALKILLNRGGVRAAPWGFQFDAYRNQLKKTWRPGGNRNPLQKFVFSVVKKIMSRQGKI